MNSKTPFKPMDEKPPNSLWELPFSLGDVDPHIIHQCLDRPHWLPQTAAQSVHALLYNHPKKSPLVTIGRPTFTPNCPLPYPWTQDDLPSQTASRFNQPFFHNTPDRFCACVKAKGRHFEHSLSWIFWKLTWKRAADVAMKWLRPTMNNISYSESLLHQM